MSECCGRILRMNPTKVMASSREGGGVGTISVVVTTIPTPASQSSSDTPAGTTATAAAATATATRRRFSHIKLVGVGGVDSQNHCCGHWFPSAKSYHRHLAEKALTDTVHEMKLVDLGMLRCTHCSMWVHVDGMSAHLRKNHGIIKVNKTAKFVPTNITNEVNRLSSETLSAGTNFVIKVSGHSAEKKTCNGNLTNPTATPVPKTGTVKLVATPSSTLFHQIKNLKHINTNNTGKVIVHKSMPKTLPYVNVGPRIVMKSIGPRKVVTLGSNCKILPHSSQTFTTTSVNGVSTLQLSAASASPSTCKDGDTFASKALSSQNNIQNVNKKKNKVVKKVTDVKAKTKSNDTLQEVLSSTAASFSAELKEKGNTSSEETPFSKPKQRKKNRKQVLKPNVSDESFVAENPVVLNMSGKKRGRKPKQLTCGEDGSPNALNHKAYRRKLKDNLDTENYTPKTSRQTPRGMRGGWRKKKRGPGRPRKIYTDDTPDLSEIDSLFDEIDNENLENAPVVMAEKAAEEEKIPTVELNLFTLPSLNEQVSVLLTEPENPNFKVYASMDAIFVGDSALGDVTNQIGYVTDSNNVVFVNPGHFLFPNIEDLGNFVPSPILTVKGNKICHSQTRQIWKLTSNMPQKIQNKESKTTSVNNNLKVVSKCDPNVEKLHAEKNESQNPPKLKGNDLVMKDSQSVGVTESTVQFKPLDFVNTVKSEVNKETKPSGLNDTSVSCTESLVKEVPVQKSPVATISESTKKNNVKRLRRKSKNMADSSKEELPKVETEPTESIPVNKSEADNLTLGKDSADSLPGNSESIIESDNVSTSTLVTPEIEQDVKLDTNSITSPPTEIEQGVKLDTNSITSPPTEIEQDVKLDTNSITSPPTEIIETPKLPLALESVSEGTLDEILKTVSPCKISRSSRKDSESELPITSPVKPENVLIVTQKITEKPSSPPSSKPKIGILPDNVEANLEEKKPVEAVTELSPTFKVNRKVLRASGVGLPRRQRRRRLRSKSAIIVSRSVVEESHSGETDKTTRLTQGRLRHFSESSALHSKENLARTDVKVLRILEDPPKLTERSGETNRCPLRGAEHSVENSSLEEASYPQTPKRTSVSPAKTINSKEPSSSCEKEKLNLRLSESGEDQDVKCKPGRKRKRRSTVCEALDITRLTTEETLGASFTDNDTLGNDCIEKTSEVRSVRERRPSFKLLESLSVTSCSSKKNVNFKTEKQIFSVSDQEEVAENSESNSALDKQAFVPVDMPIDLPVEKTSPSKEEPPVTVPLIENYSSPPREWHGRGAKLKAQVLIQDQQAGVTDSQISSCDETPCSNQASSPNITQSSPSKTQSMTSSPLFSKSSVTTPTKSPKVCKSPSFLQNREWQARGAKLKAQVMISDQNNSLIQFNESEETSQLLSPPAKKMKLEASVSNIKDIRTFFNVQKSPAGKVEVSSEQLSPHRTPTVVTPKAKTPKSKKYLNERSTSDIRSFFSPNTAATKRKPSSPNNALSVSPKKSPKTDSRKEIFQKQIKVEPLALSSCDFEGFERCSRQSGLRAKSLMRLVSLLNMKRWYNLGNFPFPIDQLCDWDDELLDSLIFADVN